MLGLGLLKALAKKPEKHTFIMAVRKLDLGKKALDELAKEIPDIQSRTELLELDISKSDSIDKAIKTITTKNIKIDCLVDNAAILMNDDDKSDFIPKKDNTPFKANMEIITNTMQTNFYGTIEFTEKILPYINNNGKVIIFGSRRGLVKKLKAEPLRKTIMKEDLTKEELVNMAKAYMNDAKNNEVEQKGWDLAAYSMSKVFIIAYGRIMRKSTAYTSRNIQIYSLCPGWVKTDLGSDLAPLTIEQGVLTPVYLFDLPWKISENQGKFFADCKVISY